MIRGTAKFDGLTLGEFSASFLGPSGAVHLEAKTAFVDSTTGATHGWTNTTTWSPETIEKLKELKEVMERDVAKVHFVGGGETLASTRKAASLGEGGLGELLSGKDAPQV